MTFIFRITLLTIFLFVKSGFTKGHEDYTTWLFDFKKHRTLSVSIGNMKGVTYAKTLKKIEHKPLRIFSLSKIFINAYVATLVKKKLITLDTPISKILIPYPTHWSNKILVRHLLEMSSGLRGPTISDPFFGLGILVQIPDPKYKYLQNENLINCIQAVEPGLDFSYSLIDHLLLVEIVNSLGSKFNVNVEFTELFKLLGLTSTKISSKKTFYGINPILKKVTPENYHYPITLKDDFTIWSTTSDLFLISQIFLKNYFGDSSVLPSNWAKYSWSSSISESKMNKVAINSNTHTFGALWWTNSLNPKYNRKPFIHLPPDLALIKGLFGQTIAVIPSQNFIMIRLSEDKASSLIDRQELILRSLARQ